MSRTPKQPRPSAKLPRELEHAMQGLAYWLGYQHIRNGGGALPHEGAIVEELASLLTLGLGAHGEHVVRREIPVDEVNGKAKRKSPGRRPAFDLAVETRADEGEATKVAYVIEVKRSANGHEGDVDRLHATSKKAGVTCRRFVLVVGHARRDLVDRRLHAARGEHVTSDGSPYAVRRVVKAVDTLQASRSSGHWVTALEVG
jgi:hypothetical protein